MVRAGEFADGGFLIAPICDRIKKNAVRLACKKHAKQDILYFRRDHMKFEEMQYRRPDVEALKGQLADLTRRWEQAEN